MAFTKAERDALPASSFALPMKRALPMTNIVHTKMAWSMLPRMSGITDAEKKQARARILERAKELGVDTSQWEIHAVSFYLDAMSLDVPRVDGHPNRMPFSGVLTRVNEVSNYPPGSKDGKANRTFIPSAVAEAALPSLLGMAIDYTEDFSGHDKRAKIGIIAEAAISGSALNIAGFLYCSDFPEECARIQSEKDRLGFSYECQALIEDPNADPWIVSHCTFTGAAVLYKHLAAYQTTSLAAKAEKEIEMNPEDLAAALASALKPVTDQIGLLAAKVEAVEKTSIEAAAVRDRVKPHADTLRACATSMEAAGIGTHATQGHVNTLRHMAASMEADAAMGNIPHIYRDHDYLSKTMEAAKAAAEKGDPAMTKALETLQASLDAATVKIADLDKKSFEAAAQPARKTMSPEITALLSKFDLAASANDGTLTVEQVNKALEGLPTAARLEQKLKLMASGVFPTAAAA